MTASQLLALSLLLSLAAAAVALSVVRAIERRIADPSLRERIWAAALYVSALPTLMVGLGLLAPAPTRIVPQADPATATFLFELEEVSGPPSANLVQDASVAALILAGLLATAAIVSLGLRLQRLRRLIGATAPAPPALRRAVEQAARDVRVPTPAVRVCGASAQALLAGLYRPVLVLPAALAESPDSATARAVCAHELAHLRRGDHRALWAEELLLAVAAFNPLLRVIRNHRAAAREEACDALALAGAAADHRRLYARALLDAVRRTGSRQAAPALTFTSARRNFVMNRLKAVLAPASPADPRARRVTLGLAALVAGAVGAGSLAVAAQRQPVLVEALEEPAPLPAFEAAAARLVAPAETTRPAAALAAAPLPTTQPVATPAPAETPAAPRSGPAQEPSPPTEITRVTWSRHPTPRYPAVAAANGVDSGTVSLSCIVGADGSASDCTVLSETPEGQGFGDAALASMEQARFSSTLMETATPGSRARFTIRFRVAE